MRCGLFLLWSFWSICHVQAFGVTSESSVSTAEGLSAISLVATLLEQHEKLTALSLDYTENPSSVSRQ